MLKIEYYTHAQASAFAWINPTHIVAIYSEPYKDGYGFTVRDGLTLKDVHGKSYGLTERCSEIMREFLRQKKVS